MDKEKKPIITAEIAERATINIFEEMEKEISFQKMMNKPLPPQ